MRKGLIVFVALMVFAVPQFAMSNDIAAQTLVLKALGASLSGNLYETYMTIGALADGFEKNVYPAAEVQKMLQINDGLIANTNAMLGDSLKGYSYAKVDADFINESLAIFEQLQTMSKALVKYTKEKTEKNAKDYTTIRDKTWAKISALLGAS